MTDRIKQNIIFLILLLIILLPALFFQDKIALKRYWREAPQALVYLPPAEMAPILALGYDSLWADMNWIRMLQYFGGLYLTSKEYPHIERIFEVIFALDPYFKDAYLFASLAIGEEVGNPEKALEFLEMGMESMPNDWQIPFDAGFLAMQTMRDYDLAKKYYLIATEKPYCPSYVFRIIPFLETEAGRYDAALFYYHEGIKDAMERNDEISMSIYQRKIRETINKIHLNNLTTALEKYREEYETLPQSLEELAAKGFIDEIPEEPFDGYYYIDPLERISSSTDNKDFLRQYLSFLRSEVNFFYNRHEQYPDSLKDLGRDLIEEPFFGEWVYDPETGSIHSSTFPDL